MEHTYMRNSNHEMLRILATFMVLGLHYLKGNVGGALDPLNSSEFNLFIAQVLESMCIGAVNIFILITGYYSYKSSKIKMNRAIELYLITITYGIVFLMLNGTITLRNVLYSVVPFLRGEAWFVETYIILLLLIPFLNKIIANCSKRSLAISIIIQVLLFSCWPTFFPSAPVTDGGYGITNFIMLYFIGAFISKYNISVNRGILFLAWGVCIAAMTMNNGWWSYCSVFCVVSALAVFLCFTQMRKISNKLINKIAGYSFAVYIIHSDSNIVHFWYLRILRTDLFWTSKWFILHFLISILVLFVLCVLIDTVRRLIFKYTVDQILRMNRFSEITIE